ncbi:hypothetical protein OH77DRAFT_1503517 [Trametes cingulata]|nr:hypothetical protein OH77DRAFT_1503517 [Trametes cingulata]
MSADAAEKSSRKHKKDKKKTDVASDGDAVKGSTDKPKKSKKAKGDSESAKPAADITPEAGDARPASPAEDIAKPKKEKKHKKRKHAEEEEEPTQPEVEEPKKKKKRKQDERDVASDTQPAPTESVEQPAETKVKKSKKKEKKGKSKEADVEESGRGGEAVADKGDVESAALSEERSPKKKEKKKDKKKRKKPGDEEENSTEAAPAKPQKKRKRGSTKSGFPDPTDDEELTEQAQKALHYAFTQYEEPSEWKFNKARQNWIIRNLWSAEAIPETYIPLVSRYLQGVQGGAREALVKACREALQPKATAEPTQAESQDGAPETEKDGEGDLPTKRTVKFAVPEAKSSNDTTDSTPADDTKRQRATALLAVLTSNAS